MEELIERAKNKDNQAFDELILNLEKEMYFIARSRLNNDDDIADVMQETIIKCLENIHKLRDASFFKTWIIRILINECNKHYKKKKNFISFDRDCIGIQNQNIENTDLSFYLLIKDLSEEERTILTLYYCAQYTTKEIANILKTKENTIKSKILRAKNKLKKENGGEIYG